jgi:hypothetical protein
VIDGCVDCSRHLRVIYPRTQCIADDWEGAQAVDGNLKESFDLGGVEVDRDRCIKRATMLAESAPGVRPFVRASVVEIWNCGADVQGRCAATGISEGEQLDQVIVHRRAGRLHDEDGLASHWL